MLSSKAKRAKCSTHKQRVIVMLYNKVCDIVSNISELLEIQLLTDTTILQVSVCFVGASFKRKCALTSVLCPAGLLDGDHTILRGERQRASTLRHQAGDCCKFSWLLSFHHLGTLVGKSLAFKRERLWFLSAGLLPL